MGKQDFKTIGFAIGTVVGSALFAQIARIYFSKYHWIMVPTLGAIGAAIGALIGHLIGSYLQTKNSTEK